MLRTDTHCAQPAASGAVPHKRRIYSQQPPACDSFNASENVNYGRVYLSSVPQFRVYLNFEEGRYILWVGKLERSMIRSGERVLVILQDSRSFASKAGVRGLIPLVCTASAIRHLDGGGWAGGCGLGGQGGVFSHQSDHGLQAIADRWYQLGLKLRVWKPMQYHQWSLMACRERSNA